MQGPVAIKISDRIRIFFAARNSDGKSFPGYVDVDVNDPTKVLQLEESPIMPFGPPGTFDDEGIMPACALQVNHELWMYYSGWNRRMTIPYHNTTGLARSATDGKTFERVFDGPILDRTPNEPYMAVTPWVLKSTDIWEMWYVSGLSWIEIGGRQEPIYGIKYATSIDGIKWNRSGDLIIPMRHANEAIARPTVFKSDGKYHMWYSYRDSVDFRDGAGSYQIGYSYSNEGKEWRRADHLSGIGLSKSGWDSTMQCYPYLLDVDGVLYMFYNGNSFGQTGIGCAVWEGSLPNL
jgi:predicted GH43/DUF377 family glycosyl hydrolase